MVALVVYESLEQLRASVWERIMNRVQLKLQPLSSSAFSPFGDVIEIERAKHFSINAGTIERYHDLGEVDLGPNDDARTLISIATCNNVSTLPYKLKLLERHPLGSQAFIPKDQTPLVIVVAPIGNSVSVAEIKAFISNGKQGINYKRGIWHMPLITLSSEQQLVIVDRGGSGNNCEEYYFDDHEIIIQESDCFSTQKFALP